MNVVAFIFSLICGFEYLYYAVSFIFDCIKYNIFSLPAPFYFIFCFIINIACVITCFAGGVMALRRQDKAKFLLGISVLLQLLRALVIFINQLYLVYHSDLDLLHWLHLDMISLLINIIRAVLTCGFAYFCVYLDNNGSIIERTKMASIVSASVPFLLLNPIFWAGAILKRRNHEYANKFLIGGILSPIIFAWLILLILPHDFIPFAFGALLICWIVIILFSGLKALFVYSVDKFLEGSNYFRGYIYISGGILILLYVGNFLSGMSLLALLPWNEMKNGTVITGVLYIAQLIVSLCSFVLHFATGAVFSIHVLHNVIYIKNQRQAANTQSVEQEIISPVSGANDKTVSVQELLKNARESLVQSNFGLASQYFEQAIASSPGNSAAYIGKLMADLKVRNANELVSLPIRLEDEELFRKALECAGPKMQETLRKYIQVNNARNTSKTTATAKESAKKGFDCLKANDFEGAEDYFTQAIAKDPSLYDAYVGSLMVKRRARTAKELIKSEPQSSVPLEQEEFFIKAMQTASPEQKQILEQCLERARNLR